MYLYVIDFLEPREFSPSGCHHFCEGAQGLAQWVFSVTAEYSGPTQSTLRARSVISHVHPELPADDRLKYWLYSADLRNHVEESHIGKVEWPTSKPICGCSQSFKSERNFRYHLHNVHKLADGIWKSRKVTSKRKRAAKEPACVDEKAQEPKLKEIKFLHYNPPNQCLQTVDSHERSTII